MGSIGAGYEAYHTHLVYSLAVAILSWIGVVWYSQQRLQYHPSQRVLLYSVAICMPLFGEIASYLLTLLRPTLDAWTGYGIADLHMALVEHVPIDALLDLFLSPTEEQIGLLLLVILFFGSLLRYYYGTVRLRRLLLRALPIAQTEYAGLAAHFGAIASGSRHELPPVLVLELAAPLAFTTGVLRPRIYLSSMLLELLAPEESVAVLCHELAHVLRRDILWNWLLRLPRDVLCFLPGSHLCWRSMITSQDEACDLLAVRMTGQPLALARALVKVAAASHASTYPRLSSVGLLAQPDASPRLRVEQMLRLNETAVVPASPMIGAYLLAALLLLFSTLPVIVGC